MHLIRLESLTLWGTALWLTVGTGGRFGDMIERSSFYCE